MKLEEITEGRVEDFMAAHEKAWIAKLEQDIARYKERKGKSEEWAEGAEWVFTKVRRRHGPY